MNETRLHPSRSDSVYVLLKKLAHVVTTYAEHIKGEKQDPGISLSVLDYGAGDAPYKPLFGDEQYIKADIAENPQADVIIDEDTGRMNVDAETIDCVLSTQVLEHVASPESYLAEAYRVLKKGGHIIVTTHGTWFYHPCPQDYWRWTLSGLTRLLENQGFRVVQCEPLVGRVGIGLQYLQDAWTLRMPELFKRPICFVFQSLIMFSEKLARHPKGQDGLCICVLGIKT